MRNPVRMLVNEYEASKFWYYNVSRHYGVPEPSRLKCVGDAIFFVWREFQSELTCRILGHDLEPEENYPFLICNRCLHEERVDG